MKKSFITFLLMIGTLVSIGIKTQAQSLGFGIKLGADMNQIKGKSLQGDFSGYFLGGLQAHVRFGRVGIQAEALFTQTKLTTGSNFQSAFQEYIKNSASSFTSTDVVLTEIAIPVLLDFRFIGPVRGELGGQYSMIIDAKDKGDYLTDPNQVIEQGYFSGLIGLKAEFASFQLGVRYLQGFNNINSTNVPERWNTGRFQISLSYLLMH